MDSLLLLKQFMTLMTVLSPIFNCLLIFLVCKNNKQPLRTLSLGQRMQCELMAAFLHNPKLVLDEPTVGLDIFSKEVIAKF